MSRAQQRRNNKQDAQAFGCLVGVIVFIAALGYNAVFGDDDKPKPKPMALPSRTSTPTPTTTTQKPDKAAKSACANLWAGTILSLASQPKRAAVFEKAAVRAASRSSVSRLQGAKDKWQVSSWCGLFLPEITDKNVDRYLPSFRKEHQRIRDAEQRGSGRPGSGDGGNRGGGINLPGRW